MKELTASEITADALLILRAKGYRVRRNHNVSAYRGARRNLVEPGWSDLEGYTDRGIKLLCEVKKNGDTLSKEQKERLLDCKKCGGVALVAYQGKSEVEIVDIENYLG